MAKRKRLSPTPIIPSRDFGDLDESPAIDTRLRAPIADVTGDAATLSAFEEVAEEIRSAKSEGRMVVRLPLAAVDTTYLVRDRLSVDADDMAVLKDSLRDRGQQTPIEVLDLGQGRYGLISGWRRLSALQVLSEDAVDADQFGHVLALIRTPDGAADAYRAMVEENEVRADLSFYERARIAVKSTQEGVYRDKKAAVQSLFAAARAPKRSKILAFAALVEALDDRLQFPAAIPEKLGLGLAQGLQKDAGLQRRISEALRKAAPQTAEAERKVLERMLKVPTKVQTTPSKEEAVSGITLKAGRGSVTLKGAKVDATFLMDLRLWLADRG